MPLLSESNTHRHTTTCLKHHHSHILYKSPHPAQNRATDTHRLLYNGAAIALYFLILAGRLGGGGWLDNVDDGVSDGHRGGRVQAGHCAGDDLIQTFGSQWFEDGQGECHPHHCHITQYGLVAVIHHDMSVKQTSFTNWQKSRKTCKKTHEKHI